MWKKNQLGHTSLDLLNKGHLGAFWKSIKSIYLLTCLFDKKRKYDNDENEKPTALIRPKFSTYNFREIIHPTI